MQRTKCNSGCSVHRRLVSIVTPAPFPPPALSSPLPPPSLSFSLFVFFPFVHSLAAFPSIVSQPHFMLVRGITPHTQLSLVTVGGIPEPRDPQGPPSVATLSKFFAFVPSARRVPPDTLLERPFRLSSPFQHSRTRNFDKWLFHERVFMRMLNVCRRRSGLDTVGYRPIKLDGRGV